jgi:hypothetical protein
MPLLGGGGVLLLLIVVVVIVPSLHKGSRWLYRNNSLNLIYHAIGVM